MNKKTLLLMIPIAILICCIKINKINAIATNYPTSAQFVRRSISEGASATCLPTNRISLNKSELPPINYKNQFGIWYILCLFVIIKALLPWVPNWLNFPSWLMSILSLLIRNQKISGKWSLTCSFEQFINLSIPGLRCPSHRVNARPSMNSGQAESLIMTPNAMATIQPSNSR